MVTANRLMLPILAIVALALSACTPIPVTTDFNNTSSNLTLMLPLGNASSGLISVSPVEPVNSMPNQEYAARLTYTEGDSIALKTDAKSPDNSPVTLEFSKPFSSDGKWETKVGDAGDYPVTIVARDARGLTSSQRILVTIKNANRAPVISGAESFTVKEGETIKLQYAPTDADSADQVVLSFSGWMKSDSYTTTYDDAGAYNVTVSVSDGKLTTTKIVPVNVINVNRAPELTVDTEKLEGIELKRVEIEASAEDRDGDKVTITYGKPFDSRGRWTPKYDDAGEYTVVVTATDSASDSTTKNVKVLIAKANRPPSIELPSTDGELRIKENELIDLRKAVTIVDAEGDEVTVTYEGWMSTSTYQTTYDDAGEHIVKITAKDETGLTTTTDLKILVEDVNRPPVFVRIA